MDIFTCLQITIIFQNCLFSENVLYTDLSWQFCCLAFDLRVYLHSCQFWMKFRLIIVQFWSELLQEFLSMCCYIPWPEKCIFPSKVVRSPTISKVNISPQIFPPAMTLSNFPIFPQKMKTNKKWPYLERPLIFRRALWSDLDHFGLVLDHHGYILDIIYRISLSLCKIYV